MQLLQQERALSAGSMGEVVIVSKGIDQVSNEKGAS